MDPVGVGAAVNVGKVGMAGSSLGWSAQDILSVAQYSPQIALAKARYVPFAPYVLSFRNTFTDSTTNAVSAQVALEGGQGTIVQPTIIDRIVFTVDEPQAFAGQTLKSVADFFFGLQSGIAATLEVQGAPRYTIAPFMTPLRNLLALMAEAWPHGWVLQHTQIPVMQFQQTIPIPVPPVTVTVSLRMWQPVGTEDFVQMTTGEAFKELAKMGYDVTAIRNDNTGR